MRVVVPLFSPIAFRACPDPGLPDSDFAIGLNSTKNPVAEADEPPPRGRWGSWRIVSGMLFICLFVFVGTVDAAEPASWLAPQAVSAVDVSADGKIITVGTMAFSHDSNVWQYSPDGSILAQRRFPPFAPMQVTTLSGGKSLAVGLAYSRFTSPEPTVWFGPSDQLLSGMLKDDFAEADSRDSEQSRWRTGAGPWREGWNASQLGELYVSGPDWVFKPPTSLMNANGKVRLSGRTNCRW